MIRIAVAGIAVIFSSFWFKVVPVPLLGHLSA